MALALEGRMGGYMAVASADPRRPSTSATAGAKPIEANSSRASRSARSAVASPLVLRQRPWPSRA